MISSNRSSEKSWNNFAVSDLATTARMRDKVRELASKRRQTGSQNATGLAAEDLGGQTPGTSLASRIDLPGSPGGSCRLSLQDGDRRRLLGPRNAALKRPLPTSYLADSSKGSSSVVERLITTVRLVLSARHISP